MAKKNVTIEVSKEAYELSEGLANFAEAVVNEIRDNGGWDMGDDLPAVISAAVTDLIPAIQGFQDISKEFQDDKKALLMGVMVNLGKMAGIFLDTGSEE
jgi:hypothetical protein